MSLTDKIKKIFESIICKIEIRPDLHVFCQNCGADITRFGGYLTDKKAIYCMQKISDEQCINILNYKMGGGIVNNFNSKEIQRAIREGSLEYYKRPNYFYINNNTTLH